MASPGDVRRGAPTSVLCCAVPLRGCAVRHVVAVRAHRACRRRGQPRHDRYELINNTKLQIDHYIFVCTLKVNMTSEFVSSQLLNTGLIFINMAKNIDV